MITAIPLYKVLNPEGNGGYSNFKWPLPTKTKPGAWVKVEGNLQICRNGFHLTSTPEKWWVSKGRIYKAEYRGEMIHKEGDKICCREARLLCEVTSEDPCFKINSLLRCLITIGMHQRGEINKADLSGADLPGADLSRADLSEAYLPGANLSRADLSEAYLPGANLSEANLSRADLSGADLSEANLSRADLSEANLSGADLSRADLSEADLSGADLSGANLSEAYLSGADLSEAYLPGANLSRADLSEANLSGAYRPNDAPAGWKISDGGILIHG